MNKYFKLLLFPAICVSLLMSLVITVDAQGPTPTVTPTITSTITSVPTQQPTALDLDSSIVIFTQLRQSEIQLTGPYDSASIVFSLPASWALNAGAELNLSFGAIFNTNSQSQSDVLLLGGGLLTIRLNNVVVATISLDEIGEVEHNFAIPVDALVSNRNDGRMTLEFILNSGDSCYIFGAHTDVFIHPTSYLVLPHRAVTPSTNLVDFPRPIFQNSFIPDSALLIIPDQPSAAELQAALTVAAGLGKLGRNTIKLDLTTLSNFVNEQASSAAATENHLIFVGKVVSIPLLNQLNLPFPVTGSQFQNKEGNTDDGIIEMVVSPWSKSHVILVVSGNTDQAIIKSAQAVSTGVIRTSRFPNLAVIKEVIPTPSSSPQAVDHTLAGIGNQGLLFDTRGSGSEDFVFNVPVGMTVSPESYFELVFGHSALIDYNTSMIVVFLNGQPIGSVHMSDITADQPTNRTKFLIPPEAIVPGQNRLGVEVIINPLDDCTPPNVQGLWIKIWPQSILHLPLITASSVSPTANLQDLAIFPAPFVYDPILSSSAFVLEHNDLGSWRDALQIAAYLGSVANGPLIELSVFYGDAFPSAVRSGYNILVVGRPTQLPIVSEMNESLPAPFLNASDIATENNFQVQFRIPSESPLGYIEMLVSPWDPDRVVVAILGNTTQGVDWAASSLIDSTLRSRLGGNFAVINDRQIITTNASLAPITTGSSSVSTQIPNAAVVSTPLAPITAPGSRPAWVLSLFVISIVLIILILIFVTTRSWSGNRTRSKAKK